MALVLCLGGCGVSPIVLAAGFGFGAGVMRVDNTLLSFWLTEKGLKAVPKSAPIAGVKLQ